MKTYIYTLIATSALALASCAKDTSIKPEQAGQMRFAVSVEGTTKASMTSTDLQQFYLKVDGPGSAFSYFESITKDQDGNWVASRPILWKNEQSAITYAAASYGALGKDYFNAPVTAELFTAGSDMGILRDQSTQAKLNAADLLTMKTTELSFANSNGGVVPITFSHGLAKVNFEFTLADEFFDNGIGLEASPVKDVVINGVAAGFNFKPLTGEVTVPALIARTAVAPFAGSYVPGTETAKGSVATFESILAPETIAAGALKLYFTVGAKDYEWTNSEPLVLAQGGEYTVPVSVAYSTDVEPEPEPAFVALPFSVSATKQVLFSQGNLMYSNGAFGFHTHQYDACVTTTGASDISSNYTAEGTFDLFGWGTSGNAHRTGYYQPWSIGGNNSNYYAYGDGAKNLYDEDGSADWGANAIGTDPAGTWRTLTKDEWTYLFANHTYGYSDVAGVKGYVIRPDGDNTAVAATYTVVEWNAQEAAGAVFLPIVGRRGTAATNFGCYGTEGTYWSSTVNGTGYFAYNVFMTASSVDCEDSSSKGQGLNVRLVKDVADPAPAAWDGDLSKLTAESTEEFATATDGMTITGTLGVNKKVSIADGATVTLNNATISYGSNGADYAGLTLLGDGTIVLADGTTNTVVGGLDSDGYSNWPGIYVPEGKTLTINGDTGVLNAARGGDDTEDGSPAGIGASWKNNCGNIVINGGVINAVGGAKSAGIGGTFLRTCGDITVNGGTITAIGNKWGSGIGLGGPMYASSVTSISGCNITITGGTVTATGGWGGAGIGTGYAEHKTSSLTLTLGNILISGGTVTATGGDKAAGIGTGGTYSSNVNNCGNITITDGVTSVTATKGSGATNSIGKGGENGTCGTVTIGGTTGAISTSPYTYQP